MKGLQTKLVAGAIALTGALLITFILFETVSVTGKIMKEKVTMGDIYTAQLQGELNNKKLTIEVDLHADHAERDERWTKVAQELNNAQQAKKHFSTLEANLKKKLEELSDNVSSKGGDFVFTRFMSKGNVDYKAIPQLSGVDLDQYRKKGFARWKLTKI